MKKKVNRIPKFKTLQEEARFWDTHSFTDFEDELEDVEMVFDLSRPRDARIAVPMEKESKNKLKKIAQSKGLNMSTLARMWLIEKLAQTK